MTPIQLTEDVINDLIEFERRRVSDPDLDKQFPCLLPTDKEGSIQVSSNTFSLIHKLADKLKEQSPSYAKTVTLGEWKKVVEHAMGAALSDIDLDVDASTTAPIVLSKIDNAVSRFASSTDCREISFGLMLFKESDVDAFEMGPVRFEARREWLARKLQDGDISKISYRRVLRHWEGNRLRKRKASFDSIQEDNISDVIGTCTYVCTVTTDGFAPDAAKEKAHMAAQLATVSVAMLLGRASWVLRHINLNYDRVFYHRRVLTFVPGKRYLAGFKISHFPIGLYLPEGEWKKKLALAQQHFQTAGEILDYIVSPSGRVPRPDMMNTFATALLWFHEACREEVDPIAVVKFAATLDTLASGGKSNGILDLIEARLGLKRDDPIRTGGPTTKSVIKEIYGEGRSRLVHGSSDRLGHDWTNVRRLAEDFSRLCLLSCIDWIANNQSVTDPKSLMI